MVASLMPLVLASCFAIAVITSEAASISPPTASTSDARSLQLGQTEADFPLQDYGPELPSPEDGLMEAYPPGQDPLAAIAEALAPSPDDYDYDTMQVMSDMMKSDIELARERPDIIPATAPEIAKAEIVANDTHKLANQIVNDSPYVLESLDRAMAPGAVLRIAEPPVTMYVDEKMKSGADKDVVVSIAVMPVLANLVGFFVPIGCVQRRVVHYIF